MTASAFHPADLNLFHRNPRVGNVAAIAESLVVNGQYKPLVVNKGTHTGRSNEVLAGNHTLKAIRDLAERHPEDARWKTVLAHVIDVDDDRADRIVLADNRTSDLGGYSLTDLQDMLDDLGDDLDGTGYSSADLVEIRSAVQRDLVADFPSPGEGPDPDEPDRPPLMRCPRCETIFDVRDAALPTDPDEAKDR